ncbi:hypothetical protein DWW96_09545 [Eubacterium sp. AF17-7]|uniref:lysozyme family protein n=1 Tax=Eubacterium sp. AF17-7 TaxID=2293105 RepID=UPI000E551A08|nr:lysozyme family protein [Eubacterium sp. AF17-7]RGG64343.1 hypothetical protein DWW96_09545 [Eubacterium sp. AF17-7]
MKQKIKGIALASIFAIVIITIAVGSFMQSIVVVLSGGNEENISTDSETIYDQSPLSEQVEALRNTVLNELGKYGKEAYIELFLAVIMQESGGNGEDVFQCSESLGQAPNSISRQQSIEHGVKVLCGYLDHEKIQVSSPEDLEHIKIALQAYNYGGGYVTYINDANRINGSSSKSDFDNLGKWTQSNALDYQKQMSAKINNGYPVQRTGSAAQILGPYKYGDAYYVKHVLRYYKKSSDDGQTIIVKAGEAANIPYENKQTFLWNANHVPASAVEMKTYLKTISVPIYDENGNKTTMNLTVHAKLAEEFKSIFEDMAKEKFKIKASETCAYVWKNIIGTGTVSQHSYGLAIDINWNDNPCFYNTNVDVSNGYGGYQPGQNQYSVTKKIIQIWKSHGFYWGGDWSGKKDTMHFSYTEKPG